jgi:hypothetical protein
MKGVFLCPGNKKCCQTGGCKIVFKHITRNNSTLKTFNLLILSKFNPCWFFKTVKAKISDHDFFS